MVQVVLLHGKFKCLLAWQRQGMGELHKIKWSGKTIIGRPQLLHMLFIRWDANYHVTTWCKMQIIIWMSYSDYSHFSDKISYKILFIPSYRLKDMNITSFKHFLKKTEGRLKLFFFTEKDTSPSGWLRAWSADWMLTGHWGLAVADKVSLPVS
jgi:hypothetical protein